MKSLDPLRAKKTPTKKKFGHTAASAIKASSVTLQIWQKEPGENTVNLQFLTLQSFQRPITLLSRNHWADFNETIDLSSLYFV